MKRPSDLVCLWELRFFVAWCQERGADDAIDVFKRTGAYAHAAHGFRLLDRALVRNLREANRARGTAREGLLREQCRIAEHALPVVGREAGEVARRAWGGR